MPKFQKQVVHDRECRACGIQLNRYNKNDLCWSCHEARQIKNFEESSTVLDDSFVSQLIPQSQNNTSTLRSILDTVRRPKTARSPDIGQVLKTYRGSNNLTQGELAKVLGFDQSYISKLENGQGLRDIAVLKNIANCLTIPLEWLGIAPEDYAVRQSSEILAIAPSVIRLSQTAREMGRAHDAVNELWPLILRLETLAIQDPHNLQLLLVLAAGQATLGIILGDLLLEEDLSASIYFCTKAVTIVEELGDNQLRSEIYRACGNELRKHKRFSEAIPHLERALSFAPDNTTKGLATALLARTYGEMGDCDHFDEVMQKALHFLDAASYFTPTFNPVMVYEIYLRGILNVGHFHKITSLVEQSIFGKISIHIAPQWHVISQLTQAEALFHTGKFDNGLANVQTALLGAEACRLPHQVQRAIRSLRLVETYNPSKQVIEEAQILLTKLSSHSHQISTTRS